MSKRKKKPPTPPPDNRKAKQTELRGLAFDIILFVVSAVAPVSVVIKWAAWIFCFGLFVYLILPLVFRRGAPSCLARASAGIGLSAVFALWMWPIAHSQWREEKADALQGNLIGASPEIDDTTPHSYPMVQIGETIFLILPQRGLKDIFPFFPDAGVKVAWGTNGWPLLTTTVRDHNGNLVVEVMRNHWRVFPAYSAEKNYTKDTLEVQDAAGHVVLQAHILRDRISLLGEWWDVQGNGVRLMRPATLAPNNGSRVLRMNQQNQHLDELIEPIFEYPSREHWGELKKDKS